MRTQPPHNILNPVSRRGKRRRTWSYRGAARPGFGAVPLELRDVRQLISLPHHTEHVDSLGVPPALILEDENGPVMSSSEQRGRVRKSNVQVRGHPRKFHRCERRGDHTWTRSDIRDSDKDRWWEFRSRLRLHLLVPINYVVTWTRRIISQVKLETRSPVLLSLLPISLPLSEIVNFCSLFTAPPRPARFGFVAYVHIASFFPIFWTTVVCLLRLKPGLRRSQTE